MTNPQKQFIKHLIDQLSDLNPMDAQLLKNHLRHYRKTHIINYITKTHQVKPYPVTTLTRNILK